MPPAIASAVAQVSPARAAPPAVPPPAAPPAVVPPLVAPPAVAPPAVAPPAVLPPAVLPPAEPPAVVPPPVTPPALPPPAEPPPVLGTQLPPEQVSEPKQPMQMRPPMPQAWGVVPGTQRLFTSQQPVAQVEGPQPGSPPPAAPPPALPPPVGFAHAPPWQMRPGPQVTHIVPPTPHAVRVVPPWQMPFMSQQPAGQFWGPQPVVEPPPALPPVPPAEPPAVLASGKKNDPPPVPPASIAWVWQVPAEHTWPRPQSALDMHLTGCFPPQACAKKRTRNAAEPTTKWWRRIGVGFCSKTGRVINSAAPAARSSQ